MVCGDIQPTFVTFKSTSQQLACSSLSTLSRGVSKHNLLPSSPKPHLAPTVFAWELQLQQGFPCSSQLSLRTGSPKPWGLHETQVSSGWLVLPFPFSIKFSILNSSEPLLASSSWLFIGCFSLLLSPYPLTAPLKQVLFVSDYPSIHWSLDCPLSL